MQIISMSAKEIQEIRGRTFSTKNLKGKKVTLAT